MWLKQLLQNTLMTIANTFDLVVATTVTAVLAVLVTSILTRSMKSKNGLPGPVGLPLIGTGLEFLSDAAQGKLHEHFTKMFDKYGSIVVVNNFGIQMIYVKDPVLVRKSLTSSTEFKRDDRLHQSGRGFFDHSLFAIPTNDVWQLHRRIAQPVFGPSAMRRAGDIASDLADQLLDRWTRLSSDTGHVVVDIHKEFNAYALDLIGRVAFSIDFGAIESLNTCTPNIARQMIGDLMHIIQTRIGLPSHHMWSLCGVGVTSPKVVAVQSWLNDTVKRIIKTKRDVYEDGVKKDSGDMDMLDRFLWNEEQCAVRDDEVVGEVAGFLIAGHETSANALTFTVLEVCRNTDAMKTLVNEIRSTVPLMKPGLNSDTVNNLKYLDAAIRETLRLNAIVGAFPRKTKTHVEYNGYTFPPDTLMMVSIRDAHRDATAFVDPDKFMPDRWLCGAKDDVDTKVGLNDSGIGMDRYENSSMTTLVGSSLSDVDDKPVGGVRTVLPNASYLPFGDGPTKCIGHRLATLELKVMIVKLLMKFNVTCVPDQRVENITTLSMGLKNGLLVSLEPRK